MHIIISKGKKTTTEHQCMHEHEAGRRTAAQQLTLNYYRKISSRKCHIITMDGTDLNVDASNVRPVSCWQRNHLRQLWLWANKKNPCGRKNIQLIILTTFNHKWVILYENTVKQAKEPATRAERAWTPWLSQRERAGSDKLGLKRMRSSSDTFHSSYVQTWASMCAYQQHETRANKQRQKNELSSNENINHFQYQNKQCTVQTHTHTHAGQVRAEV